jgi:BioD-like phosphotransacetylase family protein
MEKLIFTSLRPSAGKTNIIIGLAKALGYRFGYIKPFGERVLYRKKRLLDYDSALVKNIFELDESPEEMSIGFDHSKLRYMYTERTIREKLDEMEQALSDQCRYLIIEGGKDLAYGTSVNLDPISLARYTGGKLIMVISGDDDSIMDHLSFLKEYIRIEGISINGVIINKVKDLEDFRETRMDQVESLGLEILGMIPFHRDLTYPSVDYISDTLFAKILAGEKNLNRKVREIFVGAMSADAAVRNPLFSKEGKLIITSGDRTDMIIAALESDTSAIVLTNNVLPPSNVISKAEEKGVPLLMVPTDTFRTAKQIDDMERLLTWNEKDKIDLLERLVKENVDLDRMLER